VRLQNGDPKRVNALNSLKRRVQATDAHARREGAIESAQNSRTKGGSDALAENARTRGVLLLKRERTH
jgi:hypothetical protein